MKLKQISYIFAVFLLLSLTACHKDVSSNAIFHDKTDTINMLELSSDNKLLFKEFSENPSDDLLKGLDPALIFQFYFLAEENQDYKTQYVLIDNRESQLCPTKEEFVTEADVNNEASKYFLERLKIDVIGTNLFKLEDKTCVIQIRFTDKNISEFRLNKINDDTWKVAYMPMQ